MVSLSNGHFIPRSDLGPTYARSWVRRTPGPNLRERPFPRSPPGNVSPTYIGPTYWNVLARPSRERQTFPKPVIETIFLRPAVSTGSRLPLTRPADLCYLGVYVAPAIERRVAGTSGRIARFGWMLPVITPPTPGGGTPLGFRLPFLFVPSSESRKPLLPLAFA